MIKQFHLLLLKEAKEKKIKTQKPKTLFSIISLWLHSQPTVKSQWHLTTTGRYLSRTCRLAEVGSGELCPKLGLAPCRGVTWG